jgi:hypothetical protein
MVILLHEKHKLALSEYVRYFGPTTPKLPIESGFAENKFWLGTNQQWKEAAVDDVHQKNVLSYYAGTAQNKTADKLKRAAQAAMAMSLGMGAPKMNFVVDLPMPPFREHQPARNRLLTPSNALRASEDAILKETGLAHKPNVRRR